MWSHVLVFIFGYTMRRNQFYLNKDKWLYRLDQPIKSKIDSDGLLVTEVETESNGRDKLLKLGSDSKTTTLISQGGTELDMSMSKFPMPEMLEA